MTAHFTDDIVDHVMHATTSISFIFPTSYLGSLGANLGKYLSLGALSVRVASSELKAPMGDMFGERCPENVCG